MANFQGKSVWRRILSSPLVLALFGVILMVFAWNMVGFIGKLEMALNKKKVALTKVEDLRASKIRLEADIANLNTEKGVEETIREKYGLGKEGEGLVVIVDEAPREDTEENQGIFKSFFYFFEKVFK